MRSVFEPAGLWYAASAMPPSQPSLKQATDADLARRVARARHAGGVAPEETELCRRFAPRIRLYGLKHLKDEERGA